jgi:hypothetical protein
MGFFSFGKSSEKVDKTKSKEEINKKTVKDWLPVKEIKDGVIQLKNDEYVKILEIVPINFKLKSKAEKKMLILNYRAFLKGCRFPMQISVQCRKANTEPHIDRIKTFYETERNPQVKKMIKGYINLVHQIGMKGTITRRYYIIYPFINPPGVKESTFNDVKKQLNEKHNLIKEYLRGCGNEVLDNSDTEFAVNVLYSYLNKRTCETQKIGKKLLALMGTFLDSTEEDDDGTGEED